MLEREAILSAVRAALQGNLAVKIAVVFGSVARGTQRPDSDVDLAVLVDRRHDLLELSASIGRTLAREVDVVDLADGDVPLREAVLRDGIVVHEAERGAAAAWWARALVDRELDLPWYTRMRDAWLETVAKSGVGDGRP